MTQFENNSCNIRDKSIKNWCEEVLKFAEINYSKN